jgi:hypothetical protein
VKWTAARANGAPVTKYTVRFRLAPGSYVIGLPSEGSMEVAGTRRSATFSQLFDLVQYIFTVSATNKVGTGPTVESGPVKAPKRTQGSPSGTLPSVRSPQS